MIRIVVLAAFSILCLAGLAYADGQSPPRVSAPGRGWVQPAPPPTPVPPAGWPANPPAPRRYVAPLHPGTRGQGRPMGGGITITVKHAAPQPAPSAAPGQQP